MHFEVVVGRINGVVGLTGFSDKKMIGHLASGPPLKPVIMRKSMSKLVKQPSFRAVGQTQTEW